MTFSTCPIVPCFTTTPLETHTQYGYFPKHLLESILGVCSLYQVRMKDTRCQQYISQHNSAYGGTTMSQKAFTKDISKHL